MELSTSNYHFAGWATCANLKCSDGRTIMTDAFKHQDGEIVPLVWNHQHNDPNNILGKALLHSRNGGMYTYCLFNDTDQGKNAKLLVEHGDIVALSICANQLKQTDARGVTHGKIREVSLVLAGANPGAFIDNVIKHGEESEDEAIIYTGEDIEIFHAEEETSEQTADQELEHAEETKKEDKPVAEEAKKTEAAEDERTVKEVFEGAMKKLDEDEQNAVYAVVGMALEDIDDDEDEDENEVNHSEGGENTMKHNVFENDQQEDVLVHADIVNDAIADGKRYATLKDSILAHAAENNITDIQELFPNEHDLNMPPEWYKENDDSWVAKVMRGVHHVPFSRVRALFAKMDEATARAHGYIKGNEKQVGLKLSILKRTTKPTTVYIKMAMDRDDLVDIQYDALPWIRAEGRKVLDAELARAYLFGDKRDPSDDDKIDEQCIRPILTDDDMYTIKYTVTDGTDFHNDFNSASENDSEAKGIIRAAIKSRKGYKGSGNLTFFTTEELVTELLLIEDQNGRRIYESETALCTALRVKEIVTVPELEQYEDVYGIFVNMNDYQVGADKGGQVTTFEDFDIDFNKEKILMETRCSGALVKPKSAIVLKKSAAQG